MEAIEGNALRGHLEGMILSILEQEEAHGYEILQQLQARSGGALSLKEGSLYPALYRLEEAGQIKAKWERAASRRRGPRRRIYSLTRKGHSELAKRREGWRHFSRVVGNIMEAPS